MERNQKIVYFKWKQVGTHWFLFWEDSSQNSQFLVDDRSSLIQLFEAKKDHIFISADYYYEDEQRIASLIKNGTTTKKMSEQELEKYLPTTLDVTQEIIKSVQVNLDTCSAFAGRKIWNLIEQADENRNEIEQQLRDQVDWIKQLTQKRKDYLNWRIHTITEFDLPLTCLRHSKGRLMEDILSPKASSKKEAFSIQMDPFLKEEIEKRPLLLELYTSLLQEKETILELGGIPVKFSGQGIKGGLKNYIDCSGENNYLYIDFNSFGPSILINHHWLEGRVEYPERYEQIRDRRIQLKKEQKKTQEYEKRMLNSFIDNFFRPESNCFCPEIGKSININGYLVMALLYDKLSPLGIKVIDANTDGLIIQCAKEDNDCIRQIVASLCQNINMSCDVDVVTKIAHKSTADYCMLFKNGTVKTIGLFGKKENDPIQSNSLRVVEEALTNYYLFYEEGIIEKTIQAYKQRNDITAFQKIRKKTKTSKEWYWNQFGVMTPVPSVSRLFIIKEESQNPIYVADKKGFVQYQPQIKYELVNDLSTFDPSRLDLSYYQTLVENQIALMNQDRKKDTNQTKVKK